MSTFPNELSSLAAKVGARLVERQEKVAVAESSAGGLISAVLVGVPGASAFYLGGIVVYTAASRQLLRGAEPLASGVRGASQPFAEYLCRTAAFMHGAEWGLSETGATGPSGNPYGDPAGHAWVGVSGPGQTIATRNVLTGRADREDNMLAFAVAALTLLAENLGS